MIEKYPKRSFQQRKQYFFFESLFKQKLKKHRRIFFTFALFYSCERVRISLKMVRQLLKSILSSLTSLFSVSKQFMEMLCYSLRIDHCLGYYNLEQFVDKVVVCLNFLQMMAELEHFAKQHSLPVIQYQPRIWNILEQLLHYKWNIQLYYRHYLKESSTILIMHASLRINFFIGPQIIMMVKQ